MNTIAGRSIFIIAVICALFFGPIPQIRADVFDDANEAIKECEKATKDAQDLNPVKSVRDAENKLDQAEQKLDEVNSKTNPKPDEKKSAQDARDQAKADADAEQEAGNQQNKGKYEDYRDALKRRREACKKLKKLIPDMQAKIGAQAKTLNEDLVSANKRTLQKANACVKKCGEPPTIAMVMPGVTPGGGTFGALVSGGQLAVNIIGTGETIGEVADVRIDNLSDQSVSFSIPPVVLESRSGKNQDYVVPQSENVALKPNESKTFPMRGVCVNRHNPPVGKGIGGDLAMNDPTGDIPRDEHSHLKRDDSDKLLRIAKSKYDAADKLEDDGKLKDMPYKDKEKRKEIVEQWSTWTDPRISEIEGGPPATKDDLKKVVYKQIPHEMTTDEKKKVDKGIDTIFDKIELTTKKAKDLEQPAETEEAETPQTGGGAINVTNGTPTPEPQTQEKKKKVGKNKKKKWPKPIQDWVDAKQAADKANFGLGIQQQIYQGQLGAYWAGTDDKGNVRSQRYKALRDACKEAQKKAMSTGTKEDQDAADKACKEAEKFLGELDRNGEFQKTENGKQAASDLSEAQKAADKANAAEREAGKNIDQDTKDHVMDEEKKSVRGTW